MDFWEELSSGAKMAIIAGVALVVLAVSVRACSGVTADSPPPKPRGLVSE